MRETVAEHPIPAGPYAVRWISYELPPIRAGVVEHVHLELENAGEVPWHPDANGGFQVGYHWLDLRGNPIVYAGIWSPIERPVLPGERLGIWCAIRGPLPAARYRLAFDVVNAGRLWFQEVGNRRLELDVDVLPRLARRTVSIVVGGTALGCVDEPTAAAEQALVGEGASVTAFLGPRARPTGAWVEQVLAAHDEGFAVVAGSLAVSGPFGRRRRLASELARWRPGFGRMPSWTAPLLCPSVVAELVPALVWLPSRAGMPALDPASLREPWVCDGRICLAVDAS